MKLSFLPLQLDDLADYHALHADPAVWEHFPSGRHVALEQSERQLQVHLTWWARGELSYWAVRDAGRLVAIGGAQPVQNVRFWNLYWRVARSDWGRGIAGQVAARAVAAAAAHSPDRPITAIMLASNPASARVAERVGLTRRWEGPDEGNPDPRAIRWVYCDRVLSAADLAKVAGTSS